MRCALVPYHLFSMIFGNFFFFLLYFLSFLELFFCFCFHTEKKNAIVDSKWICNYVREIARVGARVQCIYWTFFFVCSISYSISELDWIMQFSGTKIINVDEWIEKKQMQNLNCWCKNVCNQAFSSKRKLMILLFVFFFFSFYSILLRILIVVLYIFFFYLIFVFLFVLKL